MPTLYGANDQRSKRDRLDKIKASLIQKRTEGGFDGDWKLVASWLAPSRVQFKTDERNRSSLNQKNIIDSTGGFALRTLESGLHAGLTSPARPWLRLTIADKALAKRPAVKAWLHQATEIMLEIFQQTNLYQALPNVYGDMGGFGTGCMGVLEDKEDLFRCYNYPLGSFAIGLNQRGIASSFVHDYRASVRQVVEQFGVQENGRDIDWSNISRVVKGAWDKGNYEQEVDISWIVLPNTDANPDRIGSRYLPFASCHYETATNEGKLLRESGFRTFPILAPRWKVTGTGIYGNECPGYTAFGDIRQLQIMQRRKGQAVAKMIDPPLVGPPELRTQKTSLLAGDITFVSSRDGKKALGPIHEVNLNIEHLRMDTYETKDLIRRAFYEELFLMLSQRQPNRGIQPLTAREVDELHEEKLIVLGPTLDRTHDELLDPLVDRVWDIMVIARMVPEAPPDLQGRPLKVEYTSILAQAQKMLGVRSLDAFLQSTVPLTEFAPEIKDKIDFRAVVDEYGDRYSVAPRIVRSNEDAEAISTHRAQGEAQAASAEQAALLARAGKDAAATPTGGNTALTAITEGMEAVA